MRFRVAFLKCLKLCARSSNKTVDVVVVATKYPHGMVYVVPRPDSLVKCDFDIFVYYRYLFIVR